MKSNLIITCIAAVLAACSSELLASAVVSGQPDPAVVDWTGVWKMDNSDRPGGVLNIAGDAGPNGTLLSGIIVFYGKNRETGQRIAIEPRTMINPHLEGNTLVFQVRHIRVPQVRADQSAPEQGLVLADSVDMTLKPGGEGKAVLNCPKCGANASIELTREQ